MTSQVRPGSDIRISSRWCITGAPHTCSIRVLSIRRASHPREATIKRISTHRPLTRGNNGKDGVSACDESDPRTQRRTGKWQTRSP